MPVWRATRFCTRLAKGPTAVYARMKANFTLGESVGFAEALDQEALNMRLSGMAKDFREGTRALGADSGSGVGLGGS